jgi:hypothetical protein
MNLFAHQNMPTDTGEKLPKRVGSMEIDLQASGLFILARLRGLKLN